MASVSGLVLESFDYYGSGTASRLLMLSGSLYAEISTNVGCGAPSWGARSGEFCLVNETINSTSARMVLDNTYTELMVRFAFSMDQLPNGNLSRAPIALRDATNAIIATLVIESTGTIALYRGNFDGTLLGRTAGPVFEPGEWIFFEFYVKVGAGSGVFELRLRGDETPVLLLTGLDLGALGVAQLTLVVKAFTALVVGDLYLDDLMIRKLDTPNVPVWLGDLAIATLMADGDGTINWDPMPRKKLGAGILDTTAANNAFVTAAQSTSLDLGSGDFTFEQFVRFDNLPTGSNYVALFGKWTAPLGLRSYQLIKCGPSLNSGALIWRMSLDGTPGTIQNIIEWPWQPDTDTWYYLCIERVAGETTLYIDGVSQGLPAPDVNTYAGVATILAIGAEASTATTAVAGTAVSGWADEHRLTVGTYRYDGDFTPPVVPFPTNVGGDPLFANVSLLAQWDSGIVDSSSFARTLTARGGAVQNTPNDGEYAFQVVDTMPPRDDTSLQAGKVAAMNELVLTANAVAGNTVTLGTTTYTFRAGTVPSPNDVLIGATEDLTLENLIAAVNAGPGSGTLYGAGTAANAEAYLEARPLAVVIAYALVAGTVGNVIVSTAVVASGGWSGGTTLAGGEDLPGPSDIEFQRLPFNATQVFAAALVSRQYKTAAGTVTTVVSFVGPQGGVTAGDNFNPSLNPTYRRDYFEADPDTAGPLTPSTIASVKGRINRTV